MAGITKRPNGHFWVQFYEADGTRKTLRLGKCPRRTAEQWKAKVESLLAAKIAGTSVTEDIAKWLITLEAPQHEKLVAVGLAESRTATGISIEKLCQDFIESRATDTNQNTQLTWKNAKRNLCKFFPGKAIDSLTVGDAQDFQRWMVNEGYSAATVSKRIQIARQIFNDAVDREWIAQNPFRKNKTGPQSNDARKVYVPSSEVEKLIKVCQGTQWPLLLALCRYIGVRCPSEVVGLTWDDVDMKAKRMVIRSPKTKRHAGKEQRVVPILPKILPHLERRLEAAEEGETVLPMVRDGTQNLRQQLGRIAKRAGVTMWPKMFHNLRASAQTDLAAEFPAHVVSAWIGNSQIVALRHYLTVTDEDFSKATKKTASQEPAEE